MQDGRDTALSLADNRVWIGKNPAAVPVVGEITLTPPCLLFAFPPLCLPGSTVPAEDCPVGSAGSVGSRCMRQTVALHCKYGKRGLAFVEAARREQSGEYSHRHCIQSGRQKKRCTLLIYRKLEVAILGQNDYVWYPASDNEQWLLEEMQEML